MIPHSAFRIPHSLSAGFSLVEMLVSLAVFGIFLVVLVGLQREFHRFDGEMRVALFSHPAPLSVLARLRRDVLDSRGYPASEGEWAQSPSTLILDTVGDEGQPLVVVWDFSKPLIARRIELDKSQTVSAWEARAVPAFRIDSWEAPDGRTGVLVTAKDGEGNVVVDQIVTPRAR
ncbi:MAG: type IV pilus modification PilV family protein [Thermoanaerobaculia bacterium]